MAETQNFEQKVTRLEKLVEDMEKGELSLEQSLKSFEEGVKLVADCHKQLGQAEQKVKILMGVSTDGKAQTKDFTEE